MEQLIVKIAGSDDRVRAVLMNGSRVNINVAPDKYQDFDIVFIVKNVSEFTNNHSWIKVFGETTLLQLPDEMTIGVPDPDGFGYLMLFEDGNRIDLTLYPLDKVVKDYWPDSLTVCLLDKDHLFENLSKPDDTDYLVKKPTEKEFLDVCNEFWWCIINVAKSLSREDITFAKEIVEVTVRPMLMKMIEWKIGYEYDFKVSFGKGGKFIKRYVDEEFYKKVLITYADAGIENNRNALNEMALLFEEISSFVAVEGRFCLNKIEAGNALKRLKDFFPG